MERSIFPEIKLFHPVERVLSIGRFIMDRLYFDVPAQPVARGGAAMLDRALDEQPQLPLNWGTVPDIAGRDVLHPIIERTDVAQLNRWDDMGRYFEDRE